MVNTVLLQGFLSREKLEQAFAEIADLSLDQTVIPVVIASKGGDAVWAVEFVDQAGYLPVKFELKIYEAFSVASYVALALGERREMKRGTILGIHRGEIRLSPSQISPAGVIDEKLTTNFKVYDTALVETLKNTGLADEKLMSELYATDWLRLPAEECLHRGIVQRLF